MLFGQTWYFLATAVITYIAIKCIYRRFFHPLANVPGPFLPAVTKLYQSYYNGRYYLQIEKLHQQYGSIVRITPNEVHIADAECYDKIYYVGSKYWKSPNFYNAMCVPNSTFGTPPNDIHRIRRGAMNPVFSRQKVLELEGIVQEKASKVCARMQDGVNNGEPVDLHHAFRAVSLDVISDFAFDRCYNFLDKEDTGAQFFEMARGIGPALWGFQQFPSLQRLALKTPPWMAPYLSKPLGYVTNLQVECVTQVEGVQQKMREKRDLGRETIFTTLLTDNGDKPEGYRIPTAWELKDEAYSVLVAASDTTGNAMTVAAFNVLHNQEIYRKLVAELEDHFPHQTTDLPFVELEKLPYLTAVIKEGLRLSFGVIGRLPRVVPAGGATFHSHYLPAGTVASMSSWMMHRDPAVFPSPNTFSPERWLVSDAESRRLDHNMVPFGRGSRQCIGMPLAYTELYVTLGTLFRKFPRGMRVWSEGTKDVIGDYEDFFSSYHPNAKREDWFKAWVSERRA
ncbi:hypothetical protein DOTSEDRAFT_178435 [Dothistroma septosporum NZE10]|uniref:Cytochrome P450 n=1 Tax=Dothistroma septosporum (strain NZE10 / CBS 128990) TaxID=675120 RepID=N1PIC7_DOTSN|nr:hypothetical protein DOTSEDRAFT_178435 [Dothistroma septosporum NZE10]